MQKFTHVAHIHGAYPKNLSPGPHQRNFLCGLLSFLDTAADDAGICAEANQSTGLAAPDRARSASDEQDAVCCIWEALSVQFERKREDLSRSLQGVHTKNPVRPYGTQILRSWHRHDVGS